MAAHRHQGTVNPHGSPHPEHGFTLIEMSVVLVIISLLLGSLLIPLEAQVDQRRISDTERQLEEIKEALMGYAVAKRHLPCPAISATNGLEDRTGTTCTLVSGIPKRVGYLPWVTLGVKPADSWGNLLRYSVTPAFSDSAAATLFTLDEPSDITIQTRNAAGTAVTLSNSVPAVVISHGKNGYGAVSDLGTTRAIPGSWTSALDEHDNATKNTAFWSRTFSANTTTTYGQFDDLIVWISPSILFSRMVAAGRLP